jgi:hypothetical protein
MKREKSSSHVSRSGYEASVVASAIGKDWRKQGLAMNLATMSRSIRRRDGRCRFYED